MTHTAAFEDAVRPSAWSEFVGQERMKARLLVSIEAALSQARRLDDILLIWPPGTGKTTLARLIAEEMYFDYASITMPIKPDRFFDIVEELEHGVLFLDEIHAANRAFQELLQPALEEDRVLLTPDGYEIDMSGIVVIAATVPEFARKVVEPLQQRFAIRPDWEPYTHDEIASIIAGMANRLGFELDAEVCSGLANACGSTPRLAKRFVKAARDLTVTNNEVTAETVLDHVGVDVDGLNGDHLEYLRTIKSQHGKMGLRNLANLMCMSPTAVEDLERTLARKGLIHLSGTGRRLTPAGRAKVSGEKKAAFINAT
jgi:Holliday junction DNA helicase RuvB